MLVSPSSQQSVFSVGDDKFKVKLSYTVSKNTKVYLDSLSMNISIVVLLFISSNAGY